MRDRCLFASCSPWQGPWLSSRTELAHGPRRPACRHEAAHLNGAAPVAASRHVERPETRHVPPLHGSRRATTLFSWSPRCSELCATANRRSRRGRVRHPGRWQRTRRQAERCMRRGHDRGRGTTASRCTTRRLCWCTVLSAIATVRARPGRSNDRLTARPAGQSLM